MTGQGPKRTHPPKVGHKKSRKGCLRCKARRVKCDEIKPVCGSCRKHDTPCNYEHLPSTSTGSSSHHPSPQVELEASESSTRPGASESRQSSFEFHVDVEALFGVDQGSGEIPETRERRLLELRLMNNYIDRVAQPFKLPQSAEVTSAWLKDIPKLALEYENVLYGIMSISATNLLRDDPADPVLLTARQNYLVLALGAQRRAVESLNDQGVDAATFTSLLILINSFAMLHERTYDPYIPAMPWLEMGKGAGSIIQFLLRANQNSYATRVKKVIQSSPYIWDDPTITDEQNRREFASVLSQTIPSNDIWDDETREAYEMTLSYVGSMHKSLRSGEPTYAICRRIICFPMYIPPRFIDFVQEQRPRALVVLAHFFAVVSRVSFPVWWIGNAGPKEIRAIRSVLPQEWHGQMIWPLAMAEAGPS